MHETRLRGACTHNLQGIDLDLEPGSLVVIAGPSGAGKSSLAFATLYAEGQRRYVESFSPYARQFLERLPRPPIDELEPVPAGIAVDRQAPVKTSRSTVATMTDVLDYVKLLWARTSALHCPDCGERVREESPQSAALRLIELHEGQRAVVTYPLVVSSTEAYLEARDDLIRDGYRRAFLEGKTRDLDEIRPSEVLDTGEPLQVITDRLKVGTRSRSRLVEALESAMRRGGGQAQLRTAEGQTTGVSRRLRCDKCDRDFRAATPGLFSFNNPVGACEDCRGFGRIITMDLERMIPDKSVSLKAGAITVWRSKSTRWERRELRKHAERVGLDLTVPVSELSPEQWKWLVEGDKDGYPKGWWGLEGWYKWLESRAYKMHVRVLLSRLRKYVTCPSCEGTRLKPEASWWKVEGHSLPEFLDMSVKRERSLLESIRGKHARGTPAALLCDEIGARLKALDDVGLGYLSLARPSRTLSGGETQRVALTGALGTGLAGAMFVLDEPTVGLHPSDVDRLSGVLRKLTSEGNLAVVVEHDPDVIRRADRVIELGPGAGAAGGKVVFDGTPGKLAKQATATGKALRDAGALRLDRRVGAGEIVVRGARGNNLHGVTASFPVGALTCVTGVSGSGKSSLIMETLAPALRKKVGAVEPKQPLDSDAIEVHWKIQNVITVDQSPLGRTSRGNAATYLKVWDVVRKRFAAEELAKMRGYGPGFFSFNVAGGRCEGCSGKGFETVEMQFLADVSFPCAECGGKRFRGPVLDVRHREQSIADLLERTADELLHIFEGDRDIQKRLRPMVDVGLGYLRLGQPLNTLSGGEAQRLKLASALVTAGTDTVLILDEPTAGLHHQDIQPLMNTLQGLVDRGATVICVEHDMLVAAQADHLVDLGPGAGEEGGFVVAQGTPEEVAAAGESRTAPFLRRALGLEDEPATVGRRTRRRGQAPGAVRVAGAREHNLRNIDVEIPHGKLVAVTGPSGSGKSTLAFDIVFAEGQRRYLETLSPYARQYMPQLPRPEVDRVVGVPPCVSLEQRTTRGGRTSTVATVTEVAHFLRLLWARAGVMRCPNDGALIETQTSAEIAESVQTRYAKKTKLQLLAPVVRAKKGHHRELLERFRKAGYRKARIDGEWATLTKDLALKRYQEHVVELEVASLPCGASELGGRIDEALSLGQGAMIVIASGRETLYSSERTCPKCGEGHPEIDPRFFSSNTRQGACSSCEGSGMKVEKKKKRGRRRKGRKKEGPPVECEDCSGSGLSDLARSVYVDDKNIEDVLGWSVAEAGSKLSKLRVSERARAVVEPTIAEASRRLEFLERVGLGYLQLDRPATTLSGGELQRVRLAAQLGSGLTGALYVLDEPTIGLHPRDTYRLVGALRELVDQGNTVLVVEHDADTIRAADHMIDVGPGGGSRGGRLLAQGTPESLMMDEASVTGQALARPLEAVHEVRKVSRSGPWLELSGARQHNLRDVDLKVPLGHMCAVTGVSGSGKSTLIREVLLPAVREALGLVTRSPGVHTAVKGVSPLQRAIEIDQSPIGRTPRSVPATYVGIWDEVRKLLAGTPEARARGYTASRFSFNVAQGRCAVCDGQGSTRVEMAFLPDVHVHCDRCNGYRFNDETLQVRLHGLHAGEILALEVSEALEVFSAVPKVRRPLEIMNALGMGYLRLGQASNTLSGGEAQRLKLVSELNTSGGQRTLYVMDEPTTGLHRDDVIRLIGILRSLADRGDTVVVIEHQPDLILASDWVVDLGPEGGEGGGRVVASGTPAKIMKSKRSHTGAVLRHEVTLAKAGASAG